jgi:DNA-binding NarL/FixJ family response regulator
VSARLLGREQELDWLEDAIARRGAGVVVGEAGIGKSSLLAEYASRSAGEAVFVPCMASLRWRPFLPLTLALGRPLAGDVMAVAVAMRRRLGDGALLLDDADAADEYTLAVVSLLVGHVPIVVSLRAGLEAEATIAAAGVTAAPRLHLQDLDDDSLLELVRARAPRLTSAERAARVRTAAGNPLFLLEGTEGVDFAVAIRARLRALPADARGALLHVALLGRETPIAWLPGGVERLLAEHFVVALGADRVGVRHALIAEHAVALASPEECREACLSLARRVEESGEAARLWEAGGDLDRARVLARRAARLSAGVERARHIALEAHLSTGPERSRLITEACEELLEYGETQRARDLLDAAPDALGAARAGAPGAAELLLVSARASWDLGRVEDAVADATLAMDAVRGTNTLTEVRLIALRAEPAVWSWDSESVAPMAEACERAAHDDRSRIHASYLRSRLLYISGQAAAACEPAAAAYALAVAGGLRSEVAATGAFYGVCLLQVDRAAEGDAVLEALIADLRAAGLEAKALEVELTRLTFQVYREPTAACISRFQAVLDEPLPRSYVAEAGANLAIVLAHVGRASEAADVLDRLPAVTGSGSALAHMARREIALAEGRFDDALASPSDANQFLLCDEVRAWAGFIAQRPVDVAPRSSTSDMLVDQAPLRVIEILARAQGGDARPADVEGLLAAADVHVASGNTLSAARVRWGAGELARRLGLESARNLLLDAERGAREIGLPPLLAQIEQSLRRAGVARRASGSRGEAAVTARQREILDLVATGYRSAEIAGRLGISPSTVDRIARVASRNLNARNRLHAAAGQSAAGDRDDRRPRGAEPVAIVPRERARDLARWQRTRGSWDAPPPPVIHLHEHTDEEILLEAVRGELLGVVLSGDEERDDRFLDDLRRLREIERYRLDEPLTARCVALAELLASGLALADAAEQLHISQRTAERDAARLRRAVGARTTAEAVRLALADVASAVRPQATARRAGAGKRPASSGAA